MRASRVSLRAWWADYIKSGPRSRTRRLGEVLEDYMIALGEPLLQEQEAPTSNASSSTTKAAQGLIVTIASAIVSVGGPCAAWLGAPDMLIAALNVIALVMLAIAMASVVEKLAHVSGHVIGSLITTTLANVLELTLSMVALKGGMLRFVQVSLLGTVMTQSLLVPGICFVLRGLSEPRDKLNKHAGAMASLVLLLAGLAYCVLTAFNETTLHKHQAECWQARTPAARPCRPDHAQFLALLRPWAHVEALPLWLPLSSPALSLKLDLGHSHVEAQILFA